MIKLSLIKLCVLDMICINEHASAKVHVVYVNVSDEENKAT